MAGGRQGAYSPKLFGNHRIFGIFNVSSDAFRTFAVGKDIFEVSNFLGNL